MSIELYDRAAVIKKDGVKYYLVKHGSKNTFSIGRRIGNDFRTQYMQRQARDSTWRLVAYGEGHMSNTTWNAPTGWVYGRIAFGNKCNIALALDKMKAVDFESYDDEQKENVKAVIYYGMPRAVDLSNIQDGVKVIHNYGTEREVRMTDHKVSFEGRDYWNLDNL